MSYLPKKKEEIKLELVNTYRQARVAETISAHLPIMSYRTYRLEKRPYK